MKINTKRNFREDLCVFFQYIFVICVVLNMNSIWIYSRELSFFSKAIKLLMGVSVICSIICKSHLKHKKIERTAYLVVVIILYVLFYFLVDEIKSYKIFMTLLELIFVFVYAVLIEDSCDSTYLKFSNVVIAIALISLFFWVFGSLTRIIKPSGVVYSFWTEVSTDQDEKIYKECASYYNLYFETQMGKLPVSGDRIRRNTAIFTEAPMASFVFSLAFLFELLLRKKSNLLKIFILIVSIFSTMSTTGIIVMILAVCYKYIFKKKNPLQLGIMVIIAPIVLVAAIIVIDNVFTTKLSSTSGVVRLDDFAAGYKAWMENPVFGNGFMNSEIIQRKMSSFRSFDAHGFSNSPMQILAWGGIYLFLPYLLSAIVGFKNLLLKRNFLRIGFYLIFIFMIMVTVVPFRMLTYYMFISLAREGKRTSQQYFIKQSETVRS